MSTLSKVGLMALLAGGLVLGGCTTDVKLTFVNTTDQTLGVTLSGPDGTDVLGTVGPKGGTLVEKIKVKNEDLPATFTFTGGEQKGQFTVNERTPSQLWIDFTPNGPQVRNKRTAITQTTEKKTGPIIIQQGTVVE